MTICCTPGRRGATLAVRKSVAVKANCSPNLNDEKVDAMDPILTPKKVTTHFLREKRTLAPIYLLPKNVSARPYLVKPSLKEVVTCQDRLWTQ